MIGENSTILALATDTSNDIVLTGDSNGYITVWDISNYCISRAESIIAQVSNKYLNFSFDPINYSSVT